MSHKIHLCRTPHSHPVLASIARSPVKTILALLVAAMPFRTTAADERAIQVPAAHVTRQNLISEVPFTAEFRPYQEVELHAKVAGYLNYIKVDIGDMVNTGDVIAELEIPELEQDLKTAEAAADRARQEVVRSEAAAHDAHLISSRLASADRAQPHLLSQQELDTAAARDREADAVLSGAQQAVREADAHVAKLKALVGYSKITVPFSGVISKRYVDPGALIQAGTASSAQTVPLVRLSELKRLRFDFIVSILYVDSIHVGDPVEIHFPSRPTMTVKISRFTHRVDMDTRKMIAEADVPNDDLSIIPGNYATAVFHPDHRENALAVPLSAIEGDDKKTALVIDANGEISERPVKTGLETPAMIEIVSGLKEGEVVVLGSRSRVQPGMKARARFLSETELK